MKSEEDEEFTIDLPVGYTYENFTETSENDIHFHCKELTTDAEIQHWVKELGEQNYVEWRVARTHPQVQGVKCRYRKDYRCQHSSTWYEPNSKAAKVRNSKNKRCPSKLSIKRIQKSKYDGGNVDTVIYLKNPHNHPTGSTANLNYRDVGVKAKERLKKLFASGHTPSSAHQVLQSEALVEFGDSYESVIADRNRVPDLSYCYNAFYKVTKKGNGTLHDDVKVEDKDDVEIDETSCTTVIKEESIVDLKMDNVVLPNRDLQTKENKVHESHTAAESLKNVFDDILHKVRSSQSPELLTASKVFCNNYRTLRRREDLRSALFKFGTIRKKSLIASSTNTSMLPARGKMCRRRRNNQERKYDVPMSTKI